MRATFHQHGGLKQADRQVSISAFGKFFKSLQSLPTQIMRLAFAGIIFTALAACGTSNLGSLLDDEPQNQTNNASPAQPQLKTGPVKIALLLPLGAGGEIGRIGLAMKNAAQMAVFDNKSATINLITKDTGGNPQGATKAVQAALNEGAEIIIGPLLSSEVSAISPTARARNIPVVAFSSVASVAGNGTYLMSFLPQQEITSIVGYAKQKGIRSIAAMLPKSQYGATIEQALVSAARRNGIDASLIKRFPRTPQGIGVPAKEMAAEMRVKRPQALLLAEGGALLSTLSAALQQNGVTAAGQKVIGTGLWDDKSTSTTPIAMGGWYAGVSPQLIKSFEQRYRSSYSATPSRLASLAYDAVSMTATLAQTAPAGQRFTSAKITNSQGFQGVNGLFRFHSNGLIERGLSILQVTANGANVLAPAPSKF